MSSLDPGSGADVQRIRALMKQRDKERAMFEEQKKRLAQLDDEVNIQPIEKKFMTEEENTLAKSLAQATYGLVTYSDFKKKREFLELGEDAKRLLHEKRREEARRKKLEDLQEEKDRKKLEIKSKLSFNIRDGDDEDYNDDDDNDDDAPTVGPRGAAGASSSAAAAAAAAGEEEDEEGPLQIKPVAVRVAGQGKKKKLGKDPTVDTSFLPDLDRTELELEERERRRLEVKEREERERNMLIEVAYNYHDGMDNRRVVMIKQGAMIAEFLEVVRKEFRELLSHALENVMFVKDDVIIPHNMTFYDLMTAKVRGRGGHLLEWTEEARERNIMRPPYIVSKTWYEQNKMSDPAKHWIVYDHDKHIRPKAEDDPYQSLFAELKQMADASTAGLKRITWAGRTDEMGRHGPRTI